MKIPLKLQTELKKREKKNFSIYNNLLWYKEDNKSKEYYIWLFPTKSIPEVWHGASKIKVVIFNFFLWNMKLKYVYFACVDIKRQAGTLY